MRAEGADLTAKESSLEIRNFVKEEDRLWRLLTKEIAPPSHLPFLSYWEPGCIGDTVGGTDKGRQKSRQPPKFLSFASKLGTTPNVAFIRFH